MDKIIEAVKRYSGYTRFIGPYWAKYTSWLAEHPNTTGAILIAFAVIAAF